MLLYKVNITVSIKVVLQKCKNNNGDCSVYILSFNLATMNHHYLIDIGTYMYAYVLF